MEHWYLLHTKLRRERQVAMLLHQRGLEVYLPLVWGKRAKVPTGYRKPYFPSYMFARMDLQRINPDIINWSPGLKELVEFAHEPAIMSDGFVRELQQRLSQIGDERRVISEIEERAKLTEIVEGPFAGYEGIFGSSLSAVERAHILLACVQREHHRLSLRTAPQTILPDR